jgi:hypothetical protein
MIRNLKKNEINITGYKEIQRRYTRSVQGHKIMASQQPDRKAYTTSGLYASKRILLIMFTDTDTFNIST